MVKCAGSKKGFVRDGCILGVVYNIYHFSSLRLNSKGDIVESEIYEQGCDFFFDNTKAIVEAIDIERFVDKEALNECIGSLTPTDSQTFIRGVSHSVMTFLDDCIHDGLFNLTP